VRAGIAAVLAIVCLASRSFAVGQPDNSASDPATFYITASSPGFMGAPGSSLICDTRGHVDYAVLKKHGSFQLTAEGVIAARSAASAFVAHAPPFFVANPQVQDGQSIFVGVYANRSGRAAIVQNALTPEETVIFGQPFTKRRGRRSAMMPMHRRRS
jgi:hypothetical protein